MERTTGQSASMGKGLNSFRNDPQLASQIVREAYIQQAGNSDDVQDIRQGKWDNKIPGFDLSTYALQHAEELVNKVPQTS
jgi:hypothetical protein